MRLHEFVTATELIELSTQLHELAAGRRLRRLTRRSIRKSPYAAKPKPLPKPSTAHPTTLSTPTTYQPIKGVKPLPPSTLAVATKSTHRPPPTNPVPLSAKLPPSMRELPSGQIAMIHAKTDPIVQKLSQQERG